MKRAGTKLIIVLTLLLLAAVLPGTAGAQEFYGEGNVLIAVDMGAYRENDDEAYP